MSQIDWSKAPEGATHYAAAAGAWEAAWYIVRSKRIAAMLNDGQDDEWLWREIDGQDEKDLIPRLVERPTAWNGTGLPPVGTVCEVDYEGWTRCEIIAHFQQRCAMVAAFTIDVVGNGAKTLDAFGAGHFRPLRTTEQLAAEEREKAIKAMLDMRSFGSGVEEFAQQLYDAGYRKVEGGAA